MKCILTVWITCFLLTLPAAGQATGVDLQARVKEQKAKDLIITYDKFRDRGQVMTKPHSLISSNEGAMSIFLSGGGPPNVLMVSVMTVWPGKLIEKTPDQFAVRFDSSGRSFQFLKGDRTLYFLFDEQRLELTAMSHDSDIFHEMFGNVGVQETLGYMISRADLERISQAKLVELRIGDAKPRKFKPDFVERIQTILKITDL